MASALLWFREQVCVCVSWIDKYEDVSEKLPVSFVDLSPFQAFTVQPRTDYRSKIKDRASTEKF